MLAQSGQAEERKANVSTAGEERNERGRYCRGREGMKKRERERESGKEGGEVRGVC